MQTLQISDYAKYLESGLQVHCEGQNYAMYAIFCNGTLHLGNSLNPPAVFPKHSKISDITPYFRPIRQMAEEINHEGKRFVPFEELAKMVGVTVFSNSSNSKNNWVLAPYRKNKTGSFDFFKFDGNVFSFLIEGDYRDVEVTCEKQDSLKEWCYKHHFWLGDQELFKTGQILELKN